MITRTAIYEGHVKDGREDEFFGLVRDRLEPIWREFPHVTAVRVQRIVDHDPDAAPIAMILEMDFADRAAVAASLEGPVRERAHAATLEVMELFEGRFYHLISEVDVLGPAAADAAAHQPTAG